MTIDLLEVQDPTEAVGCHSSIEVQEQATESKVNSREHYTAYLQVLGGFFCMFNCWGLTNTFGEFQTFYEADLLKPHSPSQISWIGSTQAFILLFVGGIFSGPIYDAGNLRRLVTAGTLLSVFGMMMTSICREYWQLFLAQGVVVGLGMSCLVLPGVTPVSQYFTSHRALATGIATSGSSLGGVIYPIVFHELQPRIGFGWASRVIGFLILGTLTIPITVMRAKAYPAARRPLFDAKILQDIPFVLFTAGSFFGMMGLYIPFFYLSTFSVDHQLVDPNTGFYLLAIINAASIFGRIIPNFFADFVGPLNTIIPCSFMCAVIAFCWTSLSSTATVILFCFFYGFFSGTYVAITAPVLALLSPNMALLGTHMGMSFGFSALGLLIGNPVAGLLLNDAGWIGPATFCGATNMLAATFMLFARTKRCGWKLLFKT